MAATSHRARGRLRRHLSQRLRRRHTTTLGRRFFRWARFEHLEPRHLLTSLWEQPPVPEDNVFLGWNEWSIYSGQQTAGQVVADDWYGSIDEPVTGVRWWGSFSGWTKSEVPDDAALPANFQIGMWTDIATGLDAAFGHPGQMLHQWTVPRDAYHVEFAGWSSDPRALVDGPAVVEPVFAFACDFAEADWFWQQQAPSLNWISIAAIDGQPSLPHPFAWITRPRDAKSEAPSTAVRILYIDESGKIPMYGAGAPISGPPNQAPWDMAFVLTTLDATDASISGFVFEDFDASGDYDAVAGDELLDDAWIELLDVDGAVIDAVLSGSPGPGEFQFGPLTPGRYTVRQQLSLTDTNGNSVPDSDEGLTPTTATEVTIDVSSGVHEVQFGDAWLGSIRGYKFEDRNLNGVDDNELRLSGVTFSLYGDSDGDSFADTQTTVTNEAGEYAFAGLCPGEYIVVETLPSDSTATTPTSWTIVVESGQHHIAEADQAAELLASGVAADEIVTDGQLAFGNMQLDYGDAPNSYFTKLAEGGPGHAIIAGGPILGTEIDPDFDGQPTVLADGDDSDGNDDEDGVVFSTVAVGGSATVAVRASIPAGLTGYLNAWIDFNQNGNWDDAGEHIFEGKQLVDGVNTLEFNVPDWAVDDAKDPTLTRFRISTVQVLPYDGPAPDGEVEDHGVWIESRLPEVRGFVYEDLDGDGMREPDEVGLDHWRVELINSATGGLVAWQKSHRVDVNGDGWFDPQTETGLYHFRDLPYGEYEVRQYEPNPNDSLEQPLVTLIDSDLGGLSGTVRFPDTLFQMVDAGGETWTRPFVPGVESNLGVPGMPTVPYFRRLVAIPEGVDPQQIGITVPQQPSVAYSMNTNLYPYQQTPIDGDENGNAEDFVKNEQAYATDAFFPSELVRFTPVPGDLRGLRLGFIEIAAFQYNPATDELRVHNEVSFDLSFGSQQSLGFLPQWSPFEQPTILDSFVNSEAVLAHLYTDVAAAASCHGEEYLILTHPNFREAADELADWKNRIGIITNVMEVGQGTERETAGAIHALIQQRYNQCEIRPSYVMLLGDAEFIPPFYVTTHDGDKAGTDVPYSIMFGRNGDLPDDMLPDLATGRVPVDTLPEAQTVVDKIVNYEQSPPFSDGFYRSASLASQFEGSGATDLRAFIQESERARDTLLDDGLSVERIYTSNAYATPNRYHDGTPLPSDLDADSGFPWDGDTQDIIDAFNEGRFLIIHRDHGWYNGWSHPEFETPDVFSDLANGDLTPVVYSINCESGYFDNETDSSYIPQGIKFIEALLRLQDRGAVGAIAATRDTNTWANTAFYRGLIDATWPQHDPAYGGRIALRRLGDINNYAKLYTLDHLGMGFGNGDVVEFEGAMDNLLLYHVFGDPTLEMWRRDPHPRLLPSDLAYETTSNHLLIQYPESGATITAYQIAEDGTAVALGRGLVQKGSAVLDFVTEPDPGLPIRFSASMDDAISVSLNATEKLGRPQVTLLASDLQEVAAETVFNQAFLIDVQAEGKLWTQVIVPGATFTGGPVGQPGIPVQSYLIAVPLGVDPQGIVIDLGQGPTIAQTLSGVNVYPFQESPIDEAPSGQGTGQDGATVPLSFYADQPFSYDRDAYQSDVPYPSDIVRVEWLGTMRGLNLAVVQVAAGQWVASTQQLTLFDAVPWTIRFPESTDGKPAGFLTQRDIGDFEAFAPYYGSVLNADTIWQHIRPGETSEPDCSGAEYLILTHPDFREAADELAQWKNDKGIVTTVHEVGAGTSLDSREEIRDYIQSHYDTCAVRPSYVMLLGDTEFIPTWYVDYYTHRENEMYQDFVWGQWRTLGSYHFAGEPGEGVTLTRRDRWDGAPVDEGTVADAVRFTRVDTGDVFIVDNDDPGFSAVGSWSESPAVNEQGGSALISTTDGDTAIWRIDLPTEGVYEVEVWYSGEKPDGTSPHEFDSKPAYDIVGATMGSDLTYARMGAIPDLMPDLALGRIPVDTLSEARAVVAKTIAYEKTPPLDATFYNNASVVGTFQGFRGGTLLGRDQRGFVEESERIRDTLLDEGYSVERIYSLSVSDAVGGPTPLRYRDGSLLPTDLGGGSGFVWNGDIDDVRNAFLDGCRWSGFGNGWSASDRRGRSERHYFRHDRHCQCGSQYYGRCGLDYSERIGNG